MVFGAGFSPPLSPLCSDTDKPLKINIFYFCLPQCVPLCNLCER